jgi:glycosyltransferase involved in cell wall biosynthesis
MPSREDPQPLVPLEAAVVGTATVGFSLGGLAKLAELQAMEVVEYPDTVALGALVDAVLVDPDRCTQLAATALATVRAHHDVDRIAERVAAELHDLRRPSGNDGDPLAEKSAIAAAEEPPQ